MDAVLLSLLLLGLSLTAPAQIRETPALLARGMTALQNGDLVAAEEAFRSALEAELAHLVRALVSTPAVGP